MAEFTGSLTIDAQDLLIQTSALSSRELGRLFRQLCEHALAGDVARIATHRFVAAYRPRWKNASSRRVFSKTQRASILHRAGYACTRCGSTSDLQLDHIVPLARGGADELWNLQTLCRRCNLHKGVRLESEIQRGA